MGRLVVSTGRSKRNLAGEQLSKNKSENNKQRFFIR